MTRELRLALVQHRHMGSRDANLAHIAREVAGAAASGARLVVLQELHNGAYPCQGADPGRFDQAEAVPGPTTDTLGAVAREHGVVIVASLFERRAPGLFHNTAAVLDPDGSLAGLYRKMHIPNDPGYEEKYYFAPGDLGFRPIDTAVGRLGVLVCWDQWFPEAARLMALAGAEILVYPTAIGWDPGAPETERREELEAWRLVQRGHAVANGVFVACCNRSGHEAAPDGRGPGIDFWGRSFACGPLGELLVEGEGDTETLLATLDRGRVERVRRTWPLLRDRRIDAYGELRRRFNG